MDDAWVFLPVIGVVVALIALALWQPWDDDP